MSRPLHFRVFMAVFIAAILGLMALYAHKVYQLNFVGSASAAPAKVASKTGSPVLYNFGIHCYPNSAAQPNCMHNGVIKAVVSLDGENADDIDYRRYAKNGIPFKVTLYLPTGSKFSGYIRVHWSKWYNVPPPTKADKHWYWQKMTTTVNGLKQTIRRPQWKYRHLHNRPIPAWFFTVTIPNAPAQACLKVVARPLVKGPPVQKATATFVDTSSTSGENIPCP